MARLRCQLSMSVDGFVAGPNPSTAQPLDKGGERLHEWAFKLAAWREPHNREGGDGRRPGARPPRRVPRWAGRLLAGEAATVMMTEVRGASNEKAKRELGWRPRHPSWRSGISEGAF